MKINWEEYYLIRETLPPAPLLEVALRYLRDHNKRLTALDYGAGSLIDTKSLVDSGFDVTALDTNPVITKYAENFGLKDTIKLLIANFEDICFLPHQFDLVNSIYALPYIQPSQINKILPNLLSSIKVNGIFCGNFYGDKLRHPEFVEDISLVSSADIDRHLENFQIVYFKNFEYDGCTYAKKDVHWHIFEVVARREY